MSLRIRLALVVAVTFAIVVVGCVYAAHVSASRELRAQTDRFLLQRASDPRVLGGHDAHGPGPGGGPDGSQDGRPLFEGTIPALVEPDAIAQYLSADGTVTQSVSSQPQLPVNAHDKAIAANGGAANLRDVSINGTPYRMVTAPLPNGGAVQVARSLQETNNVLGTLDVRLLIIAVIGTILAAGLAWLIARSTVRPVEQLTGAAERVAATQDLRHRIDIERNDELGRLASSFNTMLVALGSSREQQQRLVMDASHELRTPLTALRTNIEMLQRAPGIDDAERAAVLAAANTELAELGDLVGELVDLATDARAEEPLQLVELAPLVERVVERARRRYDGTITFTSYQPVEVNARVSAIDRAVTNLLDNACKFSPAGGLVEVEVDRTRIEVRDRGPGIDESERAHVFDRFYRAPEARTTPGSGLGLAIVKQIVDLHGGTVALAARDGGGTVARLELPPA
ncbi:MAG TPA: HAMP domain-containing sensor histidine kinase [Acidimicrobiia bacterium]|nr:HAMP domain-containing sensor histidine kinase [Acidimicrobiia bacterium]